MHSHPANGKHIQPGWQVAEWEALLLLSITLALLPQTLAALTAQLPGSYVVITQKLLQVTSTQRQALTYQTLFCQSPFVYVSTFSMLMQAKRVNALLTCKCAHLLRACRTKQQLQAACL